MLNHTAGSDCDCDSEQPLHHNSSLGPASDCLMNIKLPDQGNCDSMRFPLRFDLIHLVSPRLAPDKKANFLQFTSEMALISLTFNSSNPQPQSNGRKCCRSAPSNISHTRRIDRFTDLPHQPLGWLGVVRIIGSIPIFSCTTATDVPPLGFP